MARREARPERTNVAGFGGRATSPLRCCVNATSSSSVTVSNNPFGAAFCSAGVAVAAALEAADVSAACSGSCSESRLAAFDRLGIKLRKNEPENDACRTCCCCCWSACVGRRDVEASELAAAHEADEEPLEGSVRASECSVSRPERDEAIVVLWGACE